MKPEDLSIILFKGAGQYDVTNRFIDDMEEGYRLHDQKVCTFDLTANFENTRKSLIDLLEKGRPMFALGINAMGQFYVEDKSIYDLVAFPHISWFVDHPVHHLNRLETIDIVVLHHSMHLTLQSHLISVYLMIPFVLILF